MDCYRRTKNSSTVSKVMTPYQSLPSHYYRGSRWLQKTYALAFPNSMYSGHNSRPTWRLQMTLPILASWWLNISSLSDFTSEQAPPLPLLIDFRIYTFGERVCTAQRLLLVFCGCAGMAPIPLIPAMSRVHSGLWWQHSGMYYIDLSIILNSYIH